MKRLYLQATVGLKGLTFLWSSTFPLPPSPPYSTFCFKQSTCSFLPLRKINLKPAPWEMAWLLSALPAIIGLTSLPKNNVTEAYMYAFGTIIAGIGPLAFGASNLAYEALTNINQGRVPATQHWRQLPMKMALVGFVIQVHGISIYFANKLIGAWCAKGEKKTSWFLRISILDRAWTTFGTNLLYTWNLHQTNLSHSLVFV